MSITVDWPSRVIHVEQVDFPLDVEVLQDALRVLERSDEGMLHPPTHKATRSPGVLGGTLTLELINSYTFTPEEGAYVAEFGGGNFVGTINYVPGVQPIVPLSSVFATESGLTADEALHLKMLWQRFGLDKDNPADFTPGGITAGEVDLVITGDGENQSTVTQQ